MTRLFHFLFFGLVASPFVLYAQNRAEYVPNEIIVKFTDGTTKEMRQRVLDEFTAVEKQTFPNLDAHQWLIPDVITLDNGKVARGVKEVQSHLELRPYIEYAEPNYLYYISATPNDPNYGDLWGMGRIQAPLAWDMETGSEDVVVGVIDTGVDWKHSDLVDNIWQNLGEDVDGDGRVLEYIGGQWVFDPDDENGIDDDGNGYVDDFVGWDFRNNDNNPYDGHSHGTHVAGTIAATGNNVIGVTGVCWTASIMALKIFSDAGFTNSAAILNAIAYSIDMQAPITNNSWGGGSYSSALYSMISLAEANNQLFVAAAGNYAQNNDVVPFFPSSYPHNNIIAVAATNDNDELAYFSHFGQTSVDVAAPGQGILSTVPGGNYALKSGTSMAAPHVAGLAALILSQCNAFSYNEIKSRIINTVDALPQLAGKCVSGGRINAYNALNNPTCCPVQANFALSDTAFCACSTINFSNTSASSTNFVWDFGDGTYSIFANPEHEYCNAGNYTVTLLASDGNCNDTHQQTLTIKPVPDATFTHIENNQTVHFFANDTNTGNSYNWAVGGNPFSSAPNPTYDFSVTGVYEVCLTVGNNDCMSDTHCTDITIYGACNIPAPEIEWEYCYGGTGANVARAIIQTSDGGFLVVGGGDDPSGTNTYWDLQAIKLNSNGGVQWQTILGGNATDGAHSVQQTPDGGYLISGYSNSNDAFVTGNHGESDAWLMKLNASGGLVWKRSLGGSEDDSASAAYQTPDNGYMFVGYAYSNDQNVSGNHGGADVWLVKLDQSRSIVWQKCLGGTGDDKAYAMEPTPDGGYIIVGSTSSGSNGDVSGGTNGGSDVWVIKVDASGTISWEQNYGGSQADEGHSIQPTSDGGYIVSGGTSSNDGDVSGNNGFTNYWVIKLDALGNMEWQKALGGGFVDQSYAVRQTMDGGYVVAGIAWSNDGDVVGNHGEWDYWVVKLDNQGQLLWQKPMGGASNDAAYDIIQTPDGGFVVVGFTDSNDGDVTNHIGASDFWVVKLHPEIILEANFTASQPCQHEAVTFTNTSTGAATYEWYVDGTSMGMDTNFVHTFAQTGVYVVTLAAFDNEGCSNTYSETIVIDDCMYPGDANKDGIVNLLDYLALSLAFGESGPPRTDQSTGFYAHPADDWPSQYTGNLFYGTNHKHADGDGNGFINVNDTIPIINNYGMATPNYGPAQIASNFPEATITPQVNAGALQEGQAVNIDIYLGDNLGNGSEGLNAYGLVFTLQYDGTLQNLDFSQSCLGNDLLTAYIVDETQKEITVALSRKDHQDVFCDGSIIKITVVIDEVPVGDPISFAVNNNNAVITNAAGNYISAGGDSTESMSVYSALDVPPVTVRATAILQGTYAPSEHFILANSQMNTNLRNKNLLPLTQPFNTAPWHYSGPEAFNSPSAIPTNAVDWVLLEIRDPNTWDVVEQKAAMLLSDGAIVDVDGITNGVKFHEIDNNQAYHLIVRSRNHLAVMSATTLTPQNYLTVYDFTRNANQAAGTNQLAEVADGVYALRAGDFNADGVINVVDFNELAAYMSAINAYLPADCNLDGIVTVHDFNAYAPNASTIGVSPVRY